MQDSAARIRPLSPLVASQIAAGEVVERPASVVKELVENSLDAGSSRITVELEQGGIELIRITDDGHGIPSDDLHLALAPHATSKIATADDLNKIGTLGFRGEALASISSVSRLSIRSRTTTDLGASILDAEGDALSPVRPAPGPVGTSITVRTLFFNTPARRKFLRTVQTEQTRCLDVVRELALGRPAVAFQATVDGRTVIDLPPGQSPRERSLAILGKELASELLEVHADRFDDSRGMALWGLLGRPSLARATNKSQHILLNGRSIRDRTIQHALSEAYRGLIEPGRYPTAVLMIEMSPEAVDVNVHPAKAEVRFRDSSSVHSTVFNAVRRTLQAADLTPTAMGLGFGRTFARPGEERAILPSQAGHGHLGAGSAPSYTPSISPTVAPAQAFADYFKRFAPAQPQTNVSYADLKSAMTETPTAITPSDAESQPTPAESGAGTAAATAPVDSAPPALAAPRPAARILQVHNSYLVTQDEQGVVIVDQHALHERVMFEHLLARVREGTLESQRLLTPVIVPASPSQLARLDELRPLLATIGVDAEPAGPKSLALYSFPTFLFERNVDPVPFMADLLEKSEGFAPGDETALRDVLDMMACKAAVKAGDHLSDLELTALLDLRESVDRSSNCPHGRPTTIRLTIRELEKLFGRL